MHTQHEHYPAKLCTTANTKTDSLITNKQLQVDEAFKHTRPIHSGHEN